MAHTLYEVHAFTANGENGNPAGVVLDADGLTDFRMQDIAADAGFSETAFVSKSEVADRKLRFFTPSTEVDLCGHATIAAWSLMHEQGQISPGLYTQETRAGLLGITIADNGLVFMQQAEAEFYETISASTLAPLLGIGKADFHPTLPAQIVSTGLRDILVPLVDKSVLSRLRPNLEAIAVFS
ncbi:MAG TPA: PhzF family phenazine biosynthesis isomerase [Candidatus Saccharimonadales bacterium]|jgi:PhzF family phenazine biosynthesis protein